MSEFTPQSYSDLINLSSGIKKRAALIGSQDGVTVNALKKVLEEDRLELTIIDNETNLTGAKSILENQSGKCEFVEAENLVKAFSIAENYVKEGKVDFLIFGGKCWDDFLEFIFEIENSIVTDSSIHIGLTKPDKYSKLLMITDSLINRNLDLKKKLKIVGSAIKFSEKINIKLPRIALLAAVEVVYPQMVSTTEAAVIAKMAERKQIKGCYLDGPLSFDIAVDQYAAEAKGVVDNEVAGKADILIAPDIATANGVYKALNQFVRAESGALIFGGKVPVVANFPSESEQNRYNSIILALLAS